MARLSLPYASGPCDVGRGSPSYPERVARWTGTWLSGAGAEMGPGHDEAPRWPGERLGAPAEGVGAIAGGGRRLLALILDLTAAGLITSFFIRPELGNEEIMVTFNYTAVVVWVLLTVPPVALFGFTPGMAPLGVRVGRLDGAERVGWWRAAVRCVLTALLIPAMVRNADGRGLHDRATGTVVVRLR